MSRNPNDPGGFYSLDLTFASAALPADITKPIALAFAYSNQSNPTTGYVGLGQTKEVLVAGDWVVFSIYDMSMWQNVSLSNVQVSVTNKLGPGRATRRPRRSPRPALSRPPA